MGIHFRETPVQDSSSPPDLFPYPYQLDLNDLTLAAMAILPPDAYALLLTTEHDIYESCEDDFCCGRAWGGSRVAIVSSARYNPVLDEVHGVEREHVWPTSHCQDFVEKMTLDSPKSGIPSRKRKRVGSSTADPMEVASPLEEAVKSHTSQANMSPSDLESAFLFRICRTASHELGHCFGLDHCMYRACVMQATASVAEDMRQPPYLCPVCEEKIARAALQWDDKGAKKKAQSKSKALSKSQLEQKNEEWRSAAWKWKACRNVVMQAFCEANGSGFKALAAWSEAIVESMPCPSTGGSVYKWAETAVPSSTTLVPA